MKLSTNLKALAAAMVLAVPAMTPATVSAEVEYNANVSSMYLWRGTDVSQGPAISGGIDFTHESGAYVKTWASSGMTGDPAVGNGYEHDVWVGYAGKAGEFGYDISYWHIDYPQSGATAGNETALELSFKDYTLGIVSGDDGYLYTTVAGEFDKVTVKYGAVTNDANSDYSHVDVSYAATSALKFTVSQASDDGAGVSEEPLIVMSYDLPIGK